MREDGPYPHIVLNPGAVQCSEGTRHRVIGIAADHVAHGYNVTQIVEQHPDLPPAQVHAALTYYYDLQKAMDAAIIARITQVERQRQHHTARSKLVAARARLAE